ncbi:hypothetical protein FPOA_09206 [Fusarium poae]|uniref:Uncharacterized protein n=1 Tax=Fusarium poae TaxID=36050 RepID=A0A1B8AQT4_FUSPO|nr:hypothetical protein FPOA_09206 [Fusarium poae]
MSREYSWEEYDPDAYYIRTRRAFKNTGNYEGTHYDFLEGPEPKGRDTRPFVSTTTIMCMITIILSLCGYFLYPDMIYTKPLPQKIVKQVPEKSIDAICDAYQSVSLMYDEVFFELYTLLEIPQRSEPGPIVAAIKHKTEQDYRDIQNDDKKERDRAEERIGLYNKIGRVLLVYDNKWLYEKQIMGSKRRKADVRSMCKGQW